MTLKSFERGSVAYKTKDYKIFIRLLGNRDVKPERVAKIRKSIETRGYISSPIIVNEKFEIIDGQGRFEALQQLGLPVEFIVKEGLTIEDCVAMNINSTNWTTNDYIHSYAERGNKDYILLEDIMQQFSFSTTIVLAAIRGNAGNGSSVSTVQSGRFHAEFWQFESGKKKLSYLEKVQKYCKNSNTLLAFLFCMQVKGVDQERLIFVASRHGADIETKGKVEEICEAIEEKYNYRLVTHNRIYFKSEYKKYCLETNAGYRTRWGNKGNERN